ncbi:peptide chain release factor H [Desulfonema ishimotonii]|uniref:Peptide chain release factor H n=1 Tax=Desulfonema ishimotonii TaxID=45657 RepID=A0A401FT35_9BACT|nr:peptide chain release factor H [Desulfonema ishimotonii]GBC60114.1 peptide chain release factor H [Desulfonema ishimotonii]
MMAWLQITSGRGPEECCQVVARLTRRVIRAAEKQAIRIRPLEMIPSEKPGGLRSALLALEGEGVSDFIPLWTGTVLWIGKSMFRPHHKRKNWYIGVTSLSPPESFRWSEKEIKTDRMRASGPGGQHVNKNETAVRITHIPTGLKTVASEERSQHLNRKLAMGRLAELLESESDRLDKRHRQNRWNRHNLLERGNPVRVYEGEKFRLIKPV